MKLNYFTEGEAKMGKEGLILQATLGLQSCNTKKDCCEILEDIWNISRADQKAKCHTEHIRTIRMIREWLVEKGSFFCKRV